ncbi:MAG: PEP-CTERM sorting domain-containing protein [Betaproteobacteria bacterium]
MKFNKITAAAIATAGLCLSLFSIPSQATLLTWALQNATFVDPSIGVTVTATGTFSYDADTPAILNNWDIVVKGDALSGVDFHFAPTTKQCGSALCTPRASHSAGTDPGTDLFSFDLDSIPDQSATLSLLTPTLTNSGGTATLLDGAFPEFFCCGITQVSADVVTGSIVAVPEPASVAWLGLGLLGLISLRRFTK